MPAGRPRIWKDPNKMWEACQKYFTKCDKAKKPYTVPGLALALDLCSRKSLFDYGNRPEFRNTVMRAKAVIEEQRCNGLLDADRKNVRGLEFDLKNNFGWTDKQEHSISGELTTKTIRLPAKAEEGAPVNLPSQAKTTIVINELVREDD